MIFKKLSLYHKTVLLIYVFLLIIVGVFWGEVFNYSLGFNKLALATFFLSQFLLLVYLYFRNRSLSLLGRLKSRHLGRVALYSFIFAVPEEIVFRGLVQGIFLSSLDTHFALITASVIFGLAHIFNGSKSLGFRGWNFKLVGLAFLAGLPLGYLFLITQSLFLPTLLHALFLFWLQIFDWKSKAESM